MKKLLTMLVLCLIFVFCAVGFSACEDDEVNSGTPTEQSNDISNVNGGGNNSNGNNSGNNVNNNPQPTADEYFTFTLLENDTYEIKVKDVNNMPASVVIPSTYNGKAVSSIGYCAFEVCSSLISITIPDSVTSIGNYAFGGCSSLISITIPDSVTSIGNYAFGGCSSLISITIPDSVTSIGNYAFYYCSSLSEITIIDSVTGIGEGAFYKCSSLTSITVDENNGYYKSIDGNLYNGDATTLIQYAIGKTATEFTIPDSVTSIGSGAFIDCHNLTNIIIPDSVTSIGDFAFGNCSGLTSITIPDSVTSIGQAAFSGCSGLTSITIGNSVASIGQAAFSGCSNLTSVYYKGTAEEWDNIWKDYGNNELTGATRYYYSETAPTSSGNYWHYYTDGITPVVWE